MRPPEPQDDHLHRPTGEPQWRESYYFNFHDPTGRAGLTYISLSPGLGLAERFIMLLLPESGQTLVCIRQDPLTCFDDGVLHEGFLQYHCLEPLERWRLLGEAACLAIPRGHEISSALEGARTGAVPVERIPVAFDLDYEACTPAYRFPEGAWDFLGGGQGHLEQMGQVRGWLRIGEEETPFAGMGGRDRSWGPREWLHAEWWNWINLQFGQDLFAGAALSRAQGREASCGFVCRDGLLLPVVQVELEARRDPDDLHLLAGRARFVTEGGPALDLEMAPVSFLHIVVGRGAGWQNHGCETLVTCRCEGLTGQGFFEYVRREAAPLSARARRQGGDDGSMAPKWA